MIAVRQEINPSELRRALGTFATGVTVMTARDCAGRGVGMTVNSFNAVSLDPPLVLWSIGRKASAFAAFTQASYWAVHILSGAQQTLARQFASSGIDRFSGVDTEFGIAGLPLLCDCAARFQCRAEAAHPAGDHLILVGEVLSLEWMTAPPLIFHAGQFVLSPVH